MVINMSSIHKKDILKEIIWTILLYVIYLIYWTSLLLVINLVTFYYFRVTFTSIIKIAIAGASIMIVYHIYKTIKKLK